MSAKVVTGIEHVCSARPQLENDVITILKISKEYVTGEVLTRYAHRFMLKFIEDRKSDEPTLLNYDDIIQIIKNSHDERLSELPLDNVEKYTNGFCIQMRSSINEKQLVIYRADITEHWWGDKSVRNIEKFATISVSQYTGYDKMAPKLSPELLNTVLSR